MGRPSKSPPAHAEPEFENRDVPDEKPATVIEPMLAGSVSQLDAARAAPNAAYERPAQAVEYIKTKAGIDMNPQYFSAIKTSTKSAGPKKAEPA